MIEQRLLSVTYTGATMPALKAVSQHLEKAEVETQAKLEQVKTHDDQISDPLNHWNLDSDMENCFLSSGQNVLLDFDLIMF